MVTGYVNPPSVDSKMLTFAQFTGATLVPATLQVTVCEEAAAQLTAVFGALTTKGPAVPFTVTFIKSSEVWPPPALLSRVTSEKFNVRATDGITSQVGVRLF